MLPNLASLSLATGVRVPASERWGDDPLTLEPWKKGKGKYGWLLKTYHEGKDGEPGKFKHERYLYNIEKLARWLLQNPTSPTTRQRADKQDMEDCIAEANRLRKLEGKVSLQEEMAGKDVQAEEDGQAEYLGVERAVWEDVERAAWEMIWDQRLDGERGQVLQNGSLMDDATVEMLEGWLSRFDHIDAKLFVAEVQNIFDAARADRRLADPRTIRALVESLEELTVSIIDPDEIMELATRPRSMPRTAWEFDMLELINLRNGGLDLLEDDASREQTKTWFRYMRMLLEVWASFIREADELASQLYLAL